MYLRASRGLCLPPPQAHSRPGRQETQTHIFPAPSADADLGPGTPVAEKAFFNGAALSWETENFLINAKRSQRTGLHKKPITHSPHPM